ncbi:hypothetical protein BH18VER1_BH18VER1_09730 [soil metagenome]
MKFAIVHFRLSIVFLSQISFHFRRSTRLVVVVSLLTAGALAGCRRALPPEEKQTRAELRQALRAHEYAKAEELARKIVLLHPEESGAWERLAHAQLGRGDIDAAKQTLEQWRARVRKLSPKFDEFAGDIAAQEHDSDRALAAWQRSQTARPKNARVLHKLVDLYRAEQRWADENAALTRLIAMEETGEGRIARALSFRRLHRWPEAFEDFRRAREIAPDDPDVRRGAKLFERLSKFLDQIEELEKRISITPGDDQLLADRAALFLNAEDGELALEDAEAALKFAPWAMRPRLFRAIALQQLGRVNELQKTGIELRIEALPSEFLQAIARIDSDISVERSNAELYVARAWQLNDVGLPSLAREDAETALRFDANSAGAYAESAYAGAKLGRGEEAFEHAKRATELDPNFSTGWHYRGELEMTRGDFVAAVESLSRAIAINQTPAALQNREACYRQIGLFAKAEEDHRAIEAWNARTSP